ncbi:hypothetical protein ACS0PU_004333 [Formica fusca]
MSCGMLSTLGAFAESRGLIFNHTKPLKNSFTCLNMSETKILLIDSNICQSKREQLIDISHMKLDNRENFDRNLDAIDIISQKLATTLHEIKHNKRENMFELSALYDKLMDNIRLNQENSYKLNLSHQNLDIIFAIANIFGFTGKVTSIGARYVLILLLPFSHAKVVADFRKLLKKLHFNSYMTKICCSGVKLDEVDSDDMLGPCLID